MCEIYSNLTMKTTERRSMTLNLEHALQIAIYKLQVSIVDLEEVNAVLERWSSLVGM